MENLKGLKRVIGISSNELYVLFRPKISVRIKYQRGSTKPSKLPVEAVGAPLIPLVCCEL